MISRRLLGLIWAVPLLAACSAAGGPEPTQTASGTEPETAYMRTVVHLGPSGAPVVTTETVTASEQLTRREAREHSRAPATTGASGLRVEGCPNCDPPGVLQPTSCDGSALWMFDQTGLTGNELCVFNAGTTRGVLDYSNIIREWVCGGAPGCHPYWWGGAVRSFYAGSQSGEFSDGGWQNYWFTAWDEDPSPGGPGYVDSATEVYLDP